MEPPAQLQAALRIVLTHVKFDFFTVELMLDNTHFDSEFWTELYGNCAPRIIFLLRITNPTCPFVLRMFPILLQPLYITSNVSFSSSHPFSLQDLHSTPPTPFFLKAQFPRFIFLILYLRTRMNVIAKPNCINFTLFVLCFDGLVGTGSMTGFNSAISTCSFLNVWLRQSVSQDWRSQALPEI